MAPARRAWRVAIEPHRRPHWVLGRQAGKSPRAYQFEYRGRWFGPRRVVMDRGFADPESWSRHGASKAALPQRERAHRRERWSVVKDRYLNSTNNPTWQAPPAARAGAGEAVPAHGGDHRAAFRAAGVCKEGPGRLPGPTVWAGGPRTPYASVHI